MSKFNVIGGDFSTGKGRMTFRSFSLPTNKPKAFFETIALTDISTLSIASEDMVKTLVTDQEILKNNDFMHKNFFIARLLDKRCFVGVTDRSTFEKFVTVHKKAKYELRKKISTRTSAIA